MFDRWRQENTLSRQDAVAEVYAMVFLVQSGFAQQTEDHHGIRTPPATAALRLVGRSCAELRGQA